MLATPTIGTDTAKLFELSSILQPVMSTAAPPTLVTSNQSARYGLLLLAQGATSVTMSLPTLPMPGDPTSLASPAATKAPSTPTTLSVEITVKGSLVPLTPVWLSKVANGPVGDAPKPTPATMLPAASKSVTSSPLLLRPTPEPE